MSKAGIANLLVRANAFAPFRFLNRDKLIVLMYHRFSAGEEFGKTSRNTLETHLKYVTRHYKVISLSEAVKRISEGERFPSRSAVITVDDGYRDFYCIAFPALKRFGVPATLYAVTDFVSGKGWIWTDIARYITTQTKKGEVDVTVGQNVVKRKLDGRGSRLSAAGAVNAELKKLPDWKKDDTLREFAASMGVAVPETPPESFGPVDWNLVREMVAHNIDFGSHTVSHPILTNVNDERLSAELNASRAVIQDKLQKEEVHFCYPNGDAAVREHKAAETAGYASAVTTEIRLCENDDDRFVVPRIDAEPELHRFVQATCGFDRLKR